MLEYEDNDYSTNLHLKPQRGSGCLVHEDRTRFIEQHKFNSETALDKDHLQRMSKKPRETSRIMLKADFKQLLKSNHPSPRKSMQPPSWVVYHQYIMIYCRSCQRSILKSVADSEMQRSLKISKIKDYQTLFEQPSSVVEVQPRKIVLQKEWKRWKRSSFYFRTNISAPAILCSPFCHLPTNRTTPFSSM